jgi:opacity protein-like surface antigen
MKRTLILFTALWMASSLAFALGPTTSFGAHVNFTLSNLPGPSPDGASQFKDVYGTGLGGGVHFDVSLMVVSFRLSADYIHYSINEDNFRNAYRPAFGNAVSNLSISGGGLGIYGLTASTKMNLLPLPIVSPYVTGGVGLAWLRRDAITTSIAGVAGATVGGDTQSARGSVSLGAGVDLHVGISLFVEARYAWIFTQGENSSYVPITVGVTF